MKKLVQYFIAHPIAINLLILAFVVFGFAGMLSMRSSFFPLIESRNISVEINYPGASPLEIEEGIVLKIEDNLKGIAGIERVTSISQENKAEIDIEIEKGADIEYILSETKNAVDRVPSFPAGMEPPIISKVERVRPTLDFNLSGEGVPLITLKKYARQIENDIRGMDGISQVELNGFPDEEIEISLNEDDLRAYQLSFEEVANKVARTNILITGGEIKTQEEDYLIRANNRYYQADDLSNIVIISNPNGQNIYLSDIAELKDKWSENPDRLYFNGKEAIEFSISNTNSEDLISTADKLKEYINHFNETHNDLRLDISSDGSKTLNQRTELLANNGLMGFLLVVFFLSLFLNYRLAFWVAAGLPISFIGMFIFASYLGITINIFALFGMIIVVGILVDDGIVIGENIYLHYEQGKSPLKAAIDGTMEVIPAIFSAIATTVIAFTAFLFMDGRMGDNFGEVAQIVIITLLISLVEAVLILPGHIAHSLKKNKKTTSSEVSKGKQIIQRINKISHKILYFCRDKTYMPYLRFCIKNRTIGFAIPICLLLLALGLMKANIVKLDFFPKIASDRVSIQLKMPQGTNEHITDSVISIIESKAWLVNEKYSKQQKDNQDVVENIVKRIGPGSANASLMINLLPGENRLAPSSVISNAIRQETGDLYGVESILFGSGRNFGGSPIEVALFSNNINELKAAKEELKQMFQERKQLKDIHDNDPAGIKEIKITLKEHAYALGLDLQQVMSQVRNSFFGKEVQRFQRGQDEIKVWVRYAQDNRSSIQNLNDMWINSRNGDRIPFSEIATYEIERGDIAINHLNGKREIMVSADLGNDKISAIDILNEIKAEDIPVLQAKYPGISIAYEGQNREAQKTTDSIGITLYVILFLIYLVMAFTFRSYAQPILLMIMIPFSLIGIVPGHLIHGLPINILSLLGIIALIGIMVNDGLVLISKFNAELRKGVKFDEALLKAGHNRFRAIFLTSVTTVAGLAPLIFEKSRQAQFLKPMAISMSYGIVVTTFLTLLLLPLLLITFNQLKVYFRWMTTGQKPTKEEVENIVESQNNH